jgi:hypothetical protein
VINPIAAPNQYFILLANTADRQATTFVTVTNDSSLVTTSRVLDPFSGSLGIQFWPNPSNGRVNAWVETAHPGQGLRVEVLNLAGQCQAALPVTAGNNPDLSLQHLPAGVYLCRVVSESGGQAGPPHKLVLTR